MSDLKPIVTVCGDGQLARMMQPAAAELDIHLRILASKPDSSAAQVTPDVVLGDYTSLEELRGVAEGADAITFEHEHVLNEHSAALIDAGFNVQPQPTALIYAQDYPVPPGKRHLRRGHRARSRPRTGTCAAR